MNEETEEFKAYLDEAMEAFIENIANNIIGQESFINMKFSNNFITKIMRKGEGDLIKMLEMRREFMPPHVYRNIKELDD